jgi:hypothetical protein
MDVSESKCLSLRSKEEADWVAIAVQPLLRPALRCNDALLLSLATAPVILTLFPPRTSILACLLQLSLSLFLSLWDGPVEA